MSSSRSPRPRKNKVLLVFPNIHILTPEVFPMELGLLSACVKQHGYQTRIHIVNSLAKLKAFPKVLEDYSPDVVGFCGISSQAQYVTEMAGIVKAGRKDVPIIVGGKNASLVPEAVVETGLFDAVVAGEGEHALVEFLQAVNDGSDFKGIRNLWYRDSSGEVVKNPTRPFIDLDSLPYSDYGALDYQAILDRNYKTVTFMTARGCPWNCTFCSVPMLGNTGSGEFCRMRSHDHVFGEFEYLQQRYNFNYIYFRDDTFTWDREWALKFCEGWASKFPYHFEILTRADCLDTELMDALKSAGCDCIWIGADSGNDYIREKVLNKNVDNEALEEVCDYMQQIGIRPCLTNMIGLPYETPEQVMDTVRLNARIYGKSNLNISAGNGPLPKVFVFSPFPGTPLWHVCEKEGWLGEIPRGFKTYQEAYLDMPQFPREEVYSWRRKFRYLVYKDTHPYFARFMRLIDSRFGRFVAEKINIAHYPFNWLMKTLSNATETNRQSA